MVEELLWKWLKLPIINSRTFTLFSCSLSVLCCLLYLWNSKRNTSFTTCSFYSHFLCLFLIFLRFKHDAFCIFLNGLMPFQRDYNVLTDNKSWFHHLVSVSTPQPVSVLGVWGVEMEQACPPPFLKTSMPPSPSPRTATSCSIVFTDTKWWNKLSLSVRASELLSEMTKN